MSPSSIQRDMRRTFVDNSAISDSKLIFRLFKSGLKRKWKLKVPHTAVPGIYDEKLKRWSSTEVWHIFYTA